MTVKKVLIPILLFLAGNIYAQKGDDLNSLFKNIDRLLYKRPKDALSCSIAAYQKARMMTRSEYLAQNYYNLDLADSSRK